MSLGKKDLDSLIAGGEDIEVVCRFCGKKYVFTADELKNIRNSSGVITSYATGAIVGEVFGCNNLNGSPQKHVKVHVFATQNADAGHNTIGLKYPVPTDENNVTTSVYDVKAVYVEVGRTVALGDALVEIE